MFPNAEIDTEFEVGEYDVSVLSPLGEGEHRFVVARVAPDRVASRDDSHVELPALQVSYDADELTLPLQPFELDRNTHDLVIYVLARETR